MLYSISGTGRGMIELILRLQDFVPYHTDAKAFYLAGTLPEITGGTSFSKADRPAWLDAIREYERRAIFPRSDVRTANPRSTLSRDPVFSLTDAIDWVRPVIRAGHKIFDSQPDHPIVEWLKHPEARGFWNGPRDGFLASLYRKLNRDEMRTILKNEVNPRTSGGTSVHESDPLLYVLFRIYAVKHTERGSPAWDLAFTDVANRSINGTGFGVQRSEWEKMFQDLIRKSHKKT